MSRWEEFTLFTFTSANKYNKLSKPLIMHLYSNHQEVVVESSPKSSISIFEDMAKNKIQDQANSFVKVAFYSR